MTDVRGVLAGVCATSEDDVSRVARGATVFDGLYAHLGFAEGELIVTRTMAYMPRDGTDRVVEDLL